jgi:Tfp pilus assembly major pilin PilA
MKDLNSIFLNEKKYSHKLISTLPLDKKRELKKDVSEENYYLILLLYILLISFIVIIIVIIILGNKHNPYKTHYLFKNDNTSKTTLLDKLHYLIFGTYNKNNFESNCNHLTCKKANYPLNDNNNKDKNDKYNYLNSFNDTKYDNVEHINDCNNNNDSNNNDNSYLNLFNTSRKCLLNSNSTNYNNNGKYNYLKI